MLVTLADYLARRRLPADLAAQLEQERRRLARSNDAGLGEDTLRMRAWQTVVGRSVGEKGC